MSQHGAIWAADLIDDLVGNGVSKQNLLKGTGLNPNAIKLEKARAPFESIARLFENAAQITNDDILGLHLGQKRNFKRGGVLSYVGISSPTVADFLKNIACYRRVFSNAIEVSIDNLEADGLLSWYFRVPASVNHRQHIEYTAAGIVAALRQLTKMEIRLQNVVFKHPRNSNLQEFNQFFGCNVQFGGAENFIQFKATDLQLPLITADDELLKVLQRCCIRTLEQSKSEPTGILFRVEHIIADRLVAREAKLENVAKEMGMSSRTLSRRLADEGTTFTDAVENLRFALAKTYLQDSGLPIIEIAFLLGYSNVSSFSYSFKNWSGASPSDFRK
jgi:AraC-like DNA-binding protein